MSVWDQTFAAVIFDMDGTLIDSTPAVYRSWRTWGAEYGLTAEQMEGLHGMPSSGVVRALLPADQHDAAIARINELERADVHDIVVLPGTTEALASLQGGKVAIATSCDRALATARITAAGLQPPDVLVTFDDVEHGKPNPDPFLVAAGRLGVDPDRCLVVEDAPAGITAAKAAGCATLAVVTTTPPEDLDADEVVPDLAAVRFRVVPDGIRVTPV